MRRTHRRSLAAACLMLLGAVALPVPALAMQLLEAVDHVELSAEISATEVNRIALLGDRVLRVVRAPDGFAVEHDAATGDLWLRRVGAAGPNGTPVTLFVGTEKGFTYRLTLTPSDRDAAQILIRNPRAMPDATQATDDASPALASDPRIGVRGRPHIAALVKLVRSVARREPPAGYAIHADTGASLAGFTVIETWRGPRFRALVLEADSLPSASLGGTAGLARTIEKTLAAGSVAAGGRVSALWLAAPGSGPKGGRLAVAVVDTAGEPR